MKILKLLSRFFLSLIFILFFNINSFSNEPVDIWNLENNIEDNADLDAQSIEEDKIIINKSVSKKKMMMIF